ncbi:hypothetical protein [Bremerella volcania]|uniref:hypothetical protein n=1 Tax=Bremerella volcania TaxID=2527984 RepID=UPI0013FD0873|nr:hypothetical protein [Bremerella volcania]
MNIALTAGFSYRDPFADRDMRNPELSKAKSRVGAKDLFNVKQRNTVRIPFDELLPGDLLVSERHVQVVLNPRNTVSVSMRVNDFQKGETFLKRERAPVLEILQGNLRSDGPTKVQRRAYDLRVSTSGERNNRYYEYNDADDTYTRQSSGDGQGWSAYDEQVDFQPRRWSFGRFNLESLVER